MNKAKLQTLAIKNDNLAMENQLLENKLRISEKENEELKERLAKSGWLDKGGELIAPPVAHCSQWRKMLEKSEGENKQLQRENEEFKNIVLTIGEYFHWIDSGDSEEVLKAQDKCVDIYRLLKGEGNVL